MPIGLNENILVMQSGGCTPVLNRSLMGVVQEASELRAFGQIYGAAHGVEGVLRQDLIDLGRLSKAAWGRIARTPGAALGSTRRKLQQEDLQPVLDVLSKNDIRCLFIIGGNDSAETGHSISLHCRAAGYALRVVNVPKTIDNDLPPHRPYTGVRKRCPLHSPRNDGRRPGRQGYGPGIAHNHHGGDGAGRWVAGCVGGPC